MYVKRGNEIILRRVEKENDGFPLASGETYLRRLCPNFLRSPLTVRSGKNKPAHFRGGGHISVE
jgi:hypothetical protein